MTTITVINEGESLLMVHSNTKNAITCESPSTRDILSPRRLNIMIIGAPNTGKTTIVEFFAVYFSSRRTLLKHGFTFFNQDGKNSNEATFGRILPTLGVRIKFLQLEDNNSEKNQIILWEMGRSLTYRPTRIPRDYLHWMQAFIFVCSADEASTMRVLNAWYDLIKGEKRNFRHVTFVHKYDLVSSHNKDITWNLREELHQNLYFTSIKTREGMTNLLKGLTSILRNLIDITEFAPQ